MSSYNNVLENEAINDSWNTIKESAGQLPLAFNGILQEEEDYDYFRFTAKKGQRFRFRAHAKKINSAVDPVLHVFNDKGATIGGNDDADNSADARYDFTVPADGDYYVRVYDMLKRSGEDFVYRVETEEFKPALVITMPEFTRRDNQFRKTMDIPRGGRFATVVNVTRQSVRCDGTLRDSRGFLPGSPIKSDQIPANVTQFPVVFYAKADAPVGAPVSANFGCTAPIRRSPSVVSTLRLLDYVRGNPNGTLYYSKTADKLPVAVCEEAPFTINLVKPDDSSGARWAGQRSRWSPPAKKALPSPSWCAGSGARLGFSCNSFGYHSRREERSGLQCSGQWPPPRSGTGKSVSWPRPMLAKESCGRHPTLMDLTYGGSLREVEGQPGHHQARPAGGSFGRCREDPGLSQCQRSN